MARKPATPPVSASGAGDKTCQKCKRDPVRCYGSECEACWLFRSSRYWHSSAFFGNTLHQRK
jgi:hypothetical protein